MSTSNSPAESPSTTTPALSAPDGLQGRDMMARNASSEGLHRSQTTTTGSRSIALGEERLIERRRAATLSEAPDRKRRFRPPEHGSDGDRDGSRQMNSGDSSVFEQGSSSSSSSRMPARSVSGAGSSSAVPIDLTSSSPPPPPPMPTLRRQPQPPPGQGQGQFQGNTDYMEYIRPENGDESGREAHVRSCIDNHGARVRSSSQPQPPAPAPAQSQSQSQLQVDTQAAAAGGNTSQQAAGTAATPVFPVRMVAFTATEKDCLGHDEGAQECTICMEEYEVGQALVRLECLCKFHKRCIVEWFERKRECPVHKS